jgi:polyhydroxybutyrate depolymerase
VKKQSVRWVALCAAASMGLAACGGGGGGDPATPSVAQEVSASLTSGGFTRTYQAHVPAKADGAAALPLVIALHGGNGTGASMRSLTSLDTVADSGGFVVAYPDGYANSWADGRGTTDAEVAGVNDVAFIAALIDDIAARTRIDSRRVYVTGISNGGMMSLRLACELSSRIAAVAPVAANMPSLLALNCAPSRAVPVMFVHGDLDPLMPRNGGTIPLGAGGAVESTAASVALWSRLNGCSATATSTTTIDTANDGTSVAFSRYGGCSGGVDNRFYDVVSGGHTWPGGLQYLSIALIGRTSSDLSASQEVWSFFREAALP